MSDVTRLGRRRRRRSDAERSIGAILDAAVEVLNGRPGASIEQVAKAAGVSRQTVYAHFPTREVLLSAAIDHVSTAAVAAMDAASLDDEPPTEALLRLANIGWRTYERYPRLLQQSADDPEAERTRHDPVRVRLERIIKRGQDADDFDQQLSPTWVATAMIALGHAAAEDVVADRMPAEQATTVLELSILRVVGATEPHRKQDRIPIRIDRHPG